MALPLVLEAIRQIEDQREQADSEELNPLKPGTKVRLNEQSGLYGLEGLVKVSSSKRVIVLLEILGNHRSVKVKPSSVDII